MWLNALFAETLLFQSVQLEPSLLYRFTVDAKGTVILHEALLYVELTFEIVGVPAVLSIFGKVIATPLGAAGEAIAPV